MIKYSDFDNILLSRADIKTLKMLKRQYLETIDYDITRKLLDAGLINRSTVGFKADSFSKYDGHFRLTRNGQLYFIYKKQKRKDQFLKTLPIVISVVALISSFRTEILLLVQLIMK